MNLNPVYQRTGRTASLSPRVLVDPTTLGGMMTECECSIHVERNGHQASAEFATLRHHDLPLLRIGSLEVSLRVQ